MPASHWVHKCGGQLREMIWAQPIVPEPMYKTIDEAPAYERVPIRYCTFIPRPFYNGTQVVYRWVYLGEVLVDREPLPKAG